MKTSKKTYVKIEPEHQSGQFSMSLEFREGESGVSSNLLLSEYHDDIDDIILKLNDMIKELDRVKIERSRGRI